MILQLNLIDKQLNTPFSGICHRDIKDENILIDSKGNITLIDFGSGSFLSELEETPFEGTQLYSPPEWVQHGQYLFEEASVWSLGKVCRSCLSSNRVYAWLKDTF